jgi:hypothetical protein
MGASKIMEEQSKQQKEQVLHNHETDIIKDAEDVNEKIAELVSLSKENCRLCGRDGYPIYLLRKAVIRKKAWGVNWSKDVPKGVAKQPSQALQKYEYVLRNVRQGYIYVLVESIEGKKEFIGYEVTPEGVFRHRPVENMVVNKCDSMAQSCTKKNHHIPASFITINNYLYKKAWIAYSKQPWSKKVREQYRTGKADLSRFTFVDLSVEATRTLSKDQISAENLFKTAVDYNRRKDNRTELLPDASAPLQPELVFEDLTITGYYSLHHFQSRKDSDWGYYKYVSEMESQLLCKIPVVVVEDNFGIVEELNYQREVNNNFTGDRNLIHKKDKNTGIPYVFSLIHTDEFEYKNAILNTIDAYEKSLDKFYKERSSGYIRHTIDESGSTVNHLTRSEIDICSNHLLTDYGTCEFVPENKSAEENFAKNWNKLKKQLDTNKIETFRKDRRYYQSMFESRLLDYSKDYAYYARWLFGKAGKNSKLSQTVISERNKNHFWEVEFDYQLKAFHKLYLDDAHIMLSSHIPPTDDVKALYDELCSDENSYYYRVIAGDNKQLFLETDSDPSSTTESTKTDGSTSEDDSSDDEFNKAMVDSINAIFGAEVSTSDGDILLGYLIRNHILSLATDISKGIATEYRNGKVLLNQTLISERLKLLAEKIANGKVTQTTLNIRMTDIAEVFNRIGEISATGGVNFKTNLKTAQGDNLYFNKADSKFYIMDVNGKSRSFTREEYATIRQKTVSLEITMVTENPRVTPKLLEEFEKLANEEVLSIQKFRQFANRVPQEVEISVMTNGDDLQQSLLKELEESKKIYHVQTENQKIVVSGLAKCFLNVVMIHFTLNAFKNNLEEIKTETDPIQKAFLLYDLTSSLIAIAGMAAEVGGHIIKMATAMNALKMTNFLTRHPYGESRLTPPKLKLAYGMKQVFNVTNKFLNFVDKGLGILAIADGAIEILKGGNLILNEKEIVAGILKLTGGFVIMVGAAMTLKLMTLTLPVATVPVVGVIVTVAGVIIIYISTLFERSKLERWFARCGFGIDNGRYPMTIAGCKQALNDFSVLVSGISPQLRFAQPDKNQEILLAEFIYRSLYLDMTIHDFDMENDKLAFIVTIMEKRNPDLKVKIQLNHNNISKKLEPKLLEDSLNTLLYGRPYIIFTHDKGRMFKYQSEEVENDNSDYTLKPVKGTKTNLVIRFKLAEVNYKAITSLLYTVELNYKKPDIINGDHIEESQPLHQFYEFDGYGIMLLNHK